MGDDITIGVTEIVNNIEVTAQPNDQIVDISITDNSDEVTLNITPTVVEVNINKGSSYAQWGNVYGTLSDQTDLQNALNLKANLVGGKVPASELPSYVDDIIEVANYAALPATGEIGKIYVTLDNNKIYRWSGSVYIEIASNSAIWGAITGTLGDQTDLQNALNAKQAALSGTGFVKISGTTISYDNTTYLSGTVAIANGGTGATTAGAALTNLGATTVGANILTSTNPSPVTTAYLKVKPDNSVEWLEANAFRIAIGAGTGNGTVTSVEAVGGYGGLTLTGTVTGSGQLTLGGTPTGSWPISITGNASSVNTVQVSTNADFYLTFADANNGSPTSEFLYTIGTIKVNPSTGALTSSSFVKSGGTSSQFLMADGSVSTGSGGTVTSVAAITLGTTGTDLSSTVANGTTTPVITLNVPTASATNRGALSAADWTTFNSKQNALTNPVTGTGTTNYISKFTGSSAIGNSLIFDNGTNVGIGTSSPSVKLVVDGGASDFTPIFAKSSLLSGGKYFGSLLAGYATNTNQSVQFGYIYDSTTAANSIAHITAYGTAEGSQFAMRANGNVQIGTTTDSGYKLDVNGTLRVGGSSGGATTPTAITMDGTYRTGGDAFDKLKFYLYKSSTETYGFGLGDLSDLQYWAGTTSTGTHRFFTSQTERMRITSAGNVGIGTTSPLRKLTITGSAGSSMLAFENSGVDYFGIGMPSGSADLAFFASASLTSERMRITSGGAIGMNTTSPSGASVLTLQESSGLTGALSMLNRNGNQRWLLAVDAYAVDDKYLAFIDATNNAVRMAIGSNGNVLIGTTTDAGAKLQVNGASLLGGALNSDWAVGISNTGTTNANGLYVNIGASSTGVPFAVYKNFSALFTVANSGAATFSSTVTASGGFFNSDIRLKDLTDYDYNVSDIKPITYLWKDGRDNKKHVGYSAQEVQKVMPDAVNEDEKGFLSVNYVEVLVAQVELLNNRMAEMQKEIELLKSK